MWKYELWADEDILVMKFENGDHVIEYTMYAIDYYQRINGEWQHRKHIIGEHIYSAYLKFFNPKDEIKVEKLQHILDRKLAELIVMCETQLADKRLYIG